MQFLHATSAFHQEKPSKPADFFVIESTNNVALTRQMPHLCAVITIMLLAKIL